LNVLIYVSGIAGLFERHALLTTDIPEVTEQPAVVVAEKKAPVIAAKPEKELTAEQLAVRDARKAAFLARKERRKEVKLAAKKRRQEKKAKEDVKPVEHKPRDPEKIARRQAAQEAKGM